MADYYYHMVQIRHFYCKMAGEYSLILSLDMGGVDIDIIPIAFIRYRII